MITNANATLYNVFMNPSTRDYGYIPVHLHGVFWDGTSIYIPHNVNAGGRQYISSVQWNKLDAKGRKKHWTIQPETKIVRGITDYHYDGDIKEIENMFDCVMDVVSIEDFCYGSADMQHWEVTVK